MLVQIYELLVVGNGAGPPSSHSRSHLQEAISESRGYFETLLRIYYLRHSFDHGNMMLTQFLSMLAFLALGKLQAFANPDTKNTVVFSFDIGDKDPKATRATLLIAQKGLKDQGRSFYLPQMRFRNIVDHMPAEELLTISGHLTIPADDPGTIQQRKTSLERQCPIDVRRVAEGSRRTQTENWISQYARLTLNQDSYDTLFGKVPSMWQES